MATSLDFTDRRSPRQSQPDYRDTGWDSLDSDLVRDAVQTIMGCSPSRMVHEHRGVVNQVWHVHFSHRAGVTLKIAPRWFAGSLLREADCLRLLDGKGVAVPRALCVVPAQEDPLRGHDLLIMTRITGTTLRDADLTCGTLSQLLRPYHQLHQTVVAGYGWFGQGLIGNRQTWRSFLLDLEEEPQVAMNLLWSNRRACVSRLLCAIPEPGPARLLYGDYNRDNFVLQPDGTVFALDFQNCFAGDPLYDWATVLLKEPKKAHYLNGVLQFTSSGRRRLAAYQARVLWNMIVYYATCDRAHSHALVRKLDRLLTTTQ